MVRVDGPAKKIAVLVVVAIVALLGLLFVGMVEFFGAVGVVVFLALVVLVVLTAVVAGLSLEVAFIVFAYAIGLTRSAVVRLGQRLGR